MGDPAEALRRIAAHVRPGGVVVFQELDLDPTVGSRSLPDETLWNETGQLGLDTLPDRIRDDAVAVGAVVWTPSFVGAYTRTPER